MTGDAHTPASRRGGRSPRRPAVDPDETIIASRRALAGREEQTSAPKTRQAAREVRSHEVRRAIGLTALSALLPGLGLLWTRRRNIGLLFLGLVAIAAISLGIIVLSGGLVQGGARLLTTKGLILLLGMCIGGGLLWLAGIVLTAVTTAQLRWPSQTRALHAGFATLMCLVVAAPTAIATRDVWVTRDTFASVFQGQSNKDAVNPGGGSNPWKDIPRVNILLFGSDAGADRVKQRPDSLIVASVDTKTGDTVLVSVPRNMGRAPLPPSNPLYSKYPNGFTCLPGQNDNACGLMEGIWQAGEDNKDLFPADSEDPGLVTTRDAVTGITGLKIDYTATVDLQGFQQLVDAMGGVYVNVKPDPNSGYDGIPIGGKLDSAGNVIPGSITGMIKPGYQKLDGFHALWYSRSRVASGDDQRMRRQRCMINNLISQVDPFTMVTKFTSIMSVAQKNIRIDMNQDDLPAFATLAERMKSGNMRSVNISDPVSNSNPNYPKIHSLVQKAIETPHNPKAATPKKSSSPAPSPSSSSTAPSSSSSSTSANPISDTADSC
ncbi:LCP family protein [Flexivirga meconopsidis]|uniref:LCP family protein n=1 Tax=Flexivirga meconopsidis TaxID=2977121 RepID=UPI00223EA1F8|nr:LCP family protein [Flexivirga meconopsidis]